MNVVSVARLDEALRALEGASESTRILAGGTDLIVELESGRAHPDRIVDLWKVDELRGIRDEAGGVRIGALTTCRALLDHPLVAQRADLLGTAAREVGAVQIQNRATIGGNLGTASPAADLNPALYALAARVRLASTRGTRELAVEEFITGYRKTARAPDELIESVFVPARPLGERRAFRKVGTRRAQSISKVVVALAVELDGTRVRSIRAAAGSVADRTLRLHAFERRLTNAELDPQAIEEAARAAARIDCAPRTDVRSTETYRRSVLHNILRTMLAGLATSRA